MFQFGVGTLSVLTNNLLAGATVTAGSSGGAVHNWQVAAGTAIIDGITATIPAQSGTYSEATGTINTGSGLLIYAYIDANSTITATCATLSAADPLNTAIGIPTAICPIARFSFGTGALSITTITAWSGGSATKTIGKVQNVKIDISVDNAQMRGGGDVYPVDSQFFNGKCEGSFDFTDETATQFLFFGGAYSSGGNTSGTWTLSAVCRPEPVSLSFTTVTNGITATYTILHAYLASKSNSYSRTDYMTPSYSFISQANIKGNVLTIQA